MSLYNFWCCATHAHRAEQDAHAHEHAHTSVYRRVPWIERARRACALSHTQHAAEIVSGAAAQPQHARKHSYVHTTHIQYYSCIMLRSILRSSRSVARHVIEIRPSVLDTSQRAQCGALACFVFVPCPSQRRRVTASVFTHIY